MTDAIRVLFVEDVETDAKLLLRTLREQWPELISQRVEHEASMQAALADGAWDIVLCDWSLPKFSALEALRVLRGLGLEIPFVIVSGTIGEEAAVQAMREGASDYVLKDKPGRLVAVVEREVREGKVHRELRQREAEVRDEQERFRATFEQAPVGIAHVGLDQVIQRVNARLAGLLGVGHEELVTRGLLDFVDADDRDGARAVNAAVFEGRESMIVREERWIGPGGPRWVNVTRSLVHDAIGQPRYALVVVEDIEGRKQAEQRFYEAQRLNAIGQLAGGIAHDFNNMLTVILTCSELAAHGLPASDARRDDLDQIERAANRAAELTHQLLAFGRRQALEPRIQDLTDLVPSNEQILRRLIRENLELALVMATEPMLVRVDSGQFLQVLFNLVINARDAIVARGTITIEVTHVEVDKPVQLDTGDLDVGDYVTLSITDTGIGMDRATQARIFEPFYTTKQLGHGTGLGLATVFGIVKQSGGGILVSSELGRGSTFKIYLPRSVEIPSVAPSVTQPIGIPPGCETILVVEDDAFVRRAAIQMLRRRGYQVLEAGSAAEALLIWETHAAAIHLVLTDVVMPQLTGPQLAARLHRAGATVKILYMSGYAEDVIVHRGELDAGVEFIAKPLTAKTLLRKIRSVLDG